MRVPQSVLGSLVVREESAAGVPASEPADLGFQGPWGRHRAPGRPGREGWPAASCRELSPPFIQSLPRLRRSRLQPHFTGAELSHSGGSEAPGFPGRGQDCGGSPDPAPSRVAAAWGPFPQITSPERKGSPGGVSTILTPWMALEGGPGVGWLFPGHGGCMGTRI